MVSRWPTWKEIKKAAEENVHVDPFQKMVALAIIEAIDANTQALIGIAAPAIVESIDAQASTFLEAASLA